ncbi:MAG TPA: AAA family ATPase, partial [Candidatus Binataceae bacterium]|nr:AAA family ATPase [Candidatus Binataceae bacterium]
MSEEAPIRSARGAFVDRVGELAELAAGLEDARGGRGRLFLVTGEPGIGKTRLADEVAAQAVSSAMTVLRAGCWEGGGTPAYWPFVQVLRAALSGAEREARLKLLSAGNAPHVALDLAQLIPELQSSAAAPADASIQTAPNPEQARFRLFDSVAAAIRSLAAQRPLMLILEDLHDADQPTLLMLRFVVGQLKNAPVLILGTYRDFEVQRSPALSQPVGDLTREGTQVPLCALSREDAARMIEERAGAPSNPRLVADIYQATAGNPLFIDGLVRVLAADGSLSNASRLNLAVFRVPDGVREAIRR